MLHIKKRYDWRSFPQAYQFLENGIQWPYWDNPDCHIRFGAGPCQISTHLNQVRVMIIGDSHGNQLFPGLQKHLSDGVISFGINCGALKDVTVSLVRYNDGNNPCGNEDALQKNLQILKENPQIILCY